MLSDQHTDGLQVETLLCSPSIGHTGIRVDSDKQHADGIEETPQHFPGIATQDLQARLSINTAFTDIEVSIIYKIKWSL